MLVQVDGFSARIKPEPKDVEEEEEEGIGDVDLFALDKENEVLTVNAKWLHHLQVGSGCLISKACDFSSQTHACSCYACHQDLKPLPG